MFLFAVSVAFCGIPTGDVINNVQIPNEWNTQNTVFQF